MTFLPVVVFFAALALVVLTIVGRTGLWFVRFVLEQRTARKRRAAERERVRRYLEMQQAEDAIEWHNGQPSGNTVIRTTVRRFPLPDRRPDDAN